MFTKLPEGGEAALCYAECWDKQRSKLVEAITKEMQKPQYAEQLRILTYDVGFSIEDFVTIMERKFASKKRT